MNKPDPLDVLSEAINGSIRGDAKDAAIVRNAAPHLIALCRAMENEREKIIDWYHRGANKDMANDDSPGSMWSEMKQATRAVEAARTALAAAVEGRK